MTMMGSPASSPIQGQMVAAIAPLLEGAEGGNDIAAFHLPLATLSVVKDAADHRQCLDAALAQLKIERFIEAGPAGLGGDNKLACCPRASPASR